MAILSNLLTQMGAFSPVGVVVLPFTVISLYSVGYIFKDSGVPIPGMGLVDLWGFVVKNKPQTATELAFENYTFYT